MMNPILKKLGYTKEDRVVILHADDVGITHASIEAYEELFEIGTISSGSVMAHSPWLPEVIQRANNHLEWDLGLHFVFNCEYDSYRWRPLTLQSLSLIDKQGYFKQDAKEVMETAEPREVKAEILAQLELVRSLDLNITHVDTHSGVLWHLRFVELYADVLTEENIFPVIAKKAFMNSFVPDLPFDEEWTKLEKRQFPFVDTVFGLPMDKALDIEERFELDKQTLLALEPGTLTHFAFHPMKDTQEARGLNRHTNARTVDYKVFIKDEMKHFLENNAIQLTGYKEIRKVLSL